MNENDHEIIKSLYRVGGHIHPDKSFTPLAKQRAQFYIKKAIDLLYEDLKETELMNNAYKVNSEIIKNRKNIVKK